MPHRTQVLYITNCNKRNKNIRLLCQGKFCCITGEQQKSSLYLLKYFLFYYNYDLIVMITYIYIHSSD